jgi:hypothetical protein
MNDPQILPVGLKSSLLDREVIDQAFKLPSQRSGLKRNGNTPIRMLGVEVSSL